MTVLDQDLIDVSLQDGTSLLGDQFTILTKIGFGGFGITYLARDNYLGRDVVIKECFPRAICYREKGRVRTRWSTDQEKLLCIIRMFVREARRIAQLQHPNIVGVQRIFEENQTAYIVLNHIEGRTLLEIIQTSSSSYFSPQETVGLLFKLLDAVKQVHQNDFLHRDIAPDNVLVDRWGAPILIDFGAAREQASRESRELSTLLVVKEGYSPQEFYFAGGKQNQSSDLYSLAATFYHLISGQAPPNSQLRAADVASGFPDPCVPLAGRFKAYDQRLLRSIDKAMQILPRDRMQSAQAWTAMIRPKDQTSRQQKPPPIEEALAKTISRVVSETNYDIVSMPAARPASAPMPDPPSVSLEWVRDFNAETMNQTSTRTAAELKTATQEYAKESQSRPRLLEKINYSVLFLLFVAGLAALLLKL